MDAFTAFKLGNIILKNRFIKTATNEGMYHNGIPSPQLTEHHRRLAQGGVALTTVAYGAVSPEGRTMEHQMYLSGEVIPPLKELTSAVQEEGALASIQLTHCGFFSKNKNLKKGKLVSSSRHLNTYGMLGGLVLSRAMDRKDLERTTADFGQAAAIAKEAGFNAVEIHMGHGYLLSQFLSPAVNKRKDEYGGTLENRVRFPLEVFEQVRKSTGPGFPILCKMNLSDDFRGGLTIEESVKVAKYLEEAGADALVLSGGYTSKTPFYLLRGDIPLKEMARAEKNIGQKIAMSVFGPMIIRKYPFEENFFLTLARRVRAAVNIPLVYLGGVVSGRGVRGVMKNGFELIAIGRALIHDPDFILKVRENPDWVSECNHCNICVAEMEKDGIKCVL